MSAARNPEPKTPAMLAFLAGEGMPPLKRDDAEPSKAMFKRADRIAQGWYSEILQASQPVTDEFGLAHRWILLKVIRRALASDQLVDVHALRVLLSAIQVAMIAAQDSPLFKDLGHYYLGQRREFPSE